MASVVRVGLLLVALCILVQGQRISDEKCSEYRRGTLRTSAIVHLLPNPEPEKITRFQCSRTVDPIVGGVDAKPGEFPHQALLGWPIEGGNGEYDFRCGGSLISDRFVLTAAHCFREGSPNIVRLAEHDLQNEYDDQVDFDIEKIMKYPSHRFKKSYHDIALIKLKQNVPFSKLIRPACLWTGSSFNFSSVIATGFGLNDTAGHKAKILQKVKLDFLDKSECDRQYRGERTFPNGVQDGQLCIGSDDGGKDTCQGDSGGSVQVITEPKGCTYHIVGVTSTALSSCGTGRSPGIYTRVSDYLDWIEATVWG